MPHIHHFFDGITLLGKLQNCCKDISILDLRCHALLCLTLTHFPEILCITFRFLLKGQRVSSDFRFTLFLFFQKGDSTGSTHTHDVDEMRAETQWLSSHTHSRTKLFFRGKSLRTSYEIFRWT